MFLKRIKEISNIGKFCSCKGIAGIEFSPATIIFAHNGSGKSTFTSILRSFQTGNNNILLGKKTLGSTGSKKVEIDFEDDSKPLVAKFENKKWTSLPDNKIFIFDTKFIAENVYDGEKMGDDHKANMHKVVVGAEGKLYAEAVSDLMGKLKKCEQIKKDFSSQYSATTFPRIYTLEQFISIPDDVDILKNIEEKKQELQFANQFEKPADLRIKSPNFSAIATTLGKKIDSLHDDVEKKIKTHADKHLSILSVGIPTLNAMNNMSKDDGHCPFCGQETSSVSDLMDAYRVYFDASYQDLQKEITKTLTEFIAWNVDESLKNLLQEIESWHKILNNKTIYDTLVSHIGTTNLKTTKENLQLEIEKKSKDFNYIVPQSDIDLVTTSISNLQSEIDAYNVAIRAFKVKVSSKKPEDIEKELKKLEIIQERHSPKWSKFCEDYEANEESAKNLKTSRKKATEELAAYSKKTFATYQSSINTVLETIGADFKIKDLSEQKDFRKADAIFCGFDLEFFGQHKVDLSGTEDKPHFKNTLSEGDKSSLAFALFVSILSHNLNLKECLVIFDDPISSFDADRKKATAKLLFTLINSAGDRPAQTIVLTHESGFLIRLHKEFGGEALYLRIFSDGLNGTIKKSNFERLDVYNTFLKPRAFEALDKIKNCLDGTVPVDKKSHDECRAVLENALESKYYLELKDDIAKHKGLGGYIDTLTTTGLMTQTLSDEFKKLLPDLHEPHHNSLDASTDSNSDGDIKTIIRSSLDLLKKI